MGCVREHIDDPGSLQPVSVLMHQRTGIARQRQAIINGLRESVMHFQQDIGDVNSKDVMEMMMMTQYFDTMKEVGCSNGNSTIFVPSGPGAVADTAAAVRSGIMQGNAMMGK